MDQQKWWEKGKKKLKTSSSYHSTVIGGLKVYNSHIIMDCQHTRNNEFHSRPSASRMMESISSSYFALTTLFYRTSIMPLNLKPLFTFLGLYKPTLLSIRCTTLKVDEWTQIKTFRALEEGGKETGRRKEKRHKQVVQVKVGREKIFQHSSLDPDSVFGFVSFFLLQVAKPTINFCLPFLSCFPLHLLSAPFLLFLCPVFPHLTLPCLSFILFLIIFGKIQSFNLVFYGSDYPYIAFPFLYHASSKERRKGGIKINK